MIDPPRSTISFDSIGASHASQQERSHTHLEESCTQDAGDKHTDNEPVESTATALAQVGSHFARHAEYLARRAIDHPDLLTKSGTMRRGAHYDHSISIPRALHPLPRDATHASYVIDFAAAQKRYVDKFYAGVLPSPGDNRYKTMNCIAHRDMIKSKYDMVALKRCSHCLEREAPYRVYHSECYEWVIANCSTLRKLGWCCHSCRGAFTLLGECDTQHQA
jgi:hypothetical protein